MPDDKSKKGPQDAARVNRGEKYEVEYEAKKTGNTPQQVRDAAKTAGPSRQNIEKQLKNKKK